MEQHPIDTELTLMLRGKYTEARKISDQMQAAGPDNIPVFNGNDRQEMWLRHTFNRGWFLLQEGKYQEGARLLDAGRYLKTYGSPPLMTSAPIFNPEQHDIKGKSVILALEGGYGDEMIHVRFAASLKRMGARDVYVACSPGLQSLFSRVEGVSRTITRGEANAVSHDFWIPGFSAGWLCGHTFEDMPRGNYLIARQESIDLWKNIVTPDKLKVGVRWAGSPKFEHQQFRRFPPEFLLALEASKETQLYSLQKDDSLLDLPGGIIDLQHLLISWEDTAAAIMNLDLVITSCTSIAHLSAALGKPTWVIVPLLPYHTWTYNCPESGHSPYYGKHVRVFRQRTPEKWNEPFQELYGKFREEFDHDLPNLPSQDKEQLRLNLGCGRNKVQGFVNVDIDPSTEPDLKVDLNTFPWPWFNDEFQHIVAKDILEHLGSSPRDLIPVLKEMYRISEHGAIWEIEFPHHRCDNAVNDPTHVRLLTETTFRMFDAVVCKTNLEKGHADSPLALQHGIDIEIRDKRYMFTAHWRDGLHRGQINEEQLSYALNTFSNVAESVQLLIQVHKPVRS